MYRHVYTMDYPDWVQYHGSLSAVANQVWQTVAICWLMPEQQSWENWINPRLTKTLDTIKNHFCDWNFDGWRVVSKQYCSNMSINMSVVMWPPYAMVHCLWWPPADRMGPPVDTLTDALETGDQRCPRDKTSIAVPTTLAADAIISW